MTTTASAHKSPTSMTTTASAHKSDRYSKKRPRTNSTSAASVESQQEDEKPLEIIMKRKEEPKKASNGNHSFSPLNEQALVVKYKECRKNYAAHIGGYVLDGCREFMPSGEEGTDAGFTCAACSCHRNFHRREIEHDWCCDCSSASASPE